MILYQINYKMQSNAKSQEKYVISYKIMKGDEKNGEELKNMNMRKTWNQKKFEQINKRTKERKRCRWKRTKVVKKY